MLATRVWSFVHKNCFDLFSVEILCVRSLVVGYSYAHLMCTVQKNQLFSYDQTNARITFLRTIITTTTTKLYEQPLLVGRCMRKPALLLLHSFGILFLFNIPLGMRKPGYDRKSQCNFLSIWKIKSCLKIFKWRFVTEKSVYVQFRCTEGKFTFPHQNCYLSYYTRHTDKNLCKWKFGSCASNLILINYTVVEFLP